MPSFSHVIECVVGVVFLARGVHALLGTRRARDRFEALGFGRAARWIVGGLELLGALGMLAGLAQPVLVFFAAIELVIVSSALFIVGRRRGARASVSAFVALVASVVAAAALQPLGLRVLALPAAASLPREPIAAARTIKRYDEGLWFESVRMGPDGTLYLAGNSGENYATGDKGNARARVIARAPDGTERTFFTLPRGSTAGVIAFDAADRMFMTGQGEQLGVWRISAAGAGSLFAPLPRGSWPNGMTAGPDGQLYVADAALGVIWRVDPVTGAATQAIAHDMLRARRFIALAPGANGVHFFGRELFVTVSDGARVLRFTLGPDGRFGAPRVVAEGIPGDDFAIDSAGALYVTTHPYNTIVRVAPDGRRTIIATAADGIVGATDATFGVHAERNTLYVATDGGAFGGNVKARGALIALTVRP